MEVKIDTKKDISKECDLFVSELLCRAVELYKQTGEYTEFQKELEQMDGMCKEKFTDEDYSFVMECFGRVLNMFVNEQKFVYSEGLKDGALLLKKLGVL